MLKKQLIVITGGPGAGKTTLINRLQEEGCSTKEEVARQIIKEQVGVGGDGVPWKNSQLFKELMFSRELYHYLHAQNVSSIFCDRGLPDVMAYSKILGHHCDEVVERACRQYQYQHKVFIAPPWEEIFHQDEERRQSFQESVEVYKILKKIYQDYGYELYELPKVNVCDRLSYMKNKIGL